MLPNIKNTMYFLLDGCLERNGYLGSMIRIDADGGEFGDLEDAGKQQNSRNIIRESPLVVFLFFLGYPQ